MCRRFLVVPGDELARIIRIIKENIRLEQQALAAAQPAEAYPKSQVSLILPGRSGLETAVMQWGYPVSWQKDVVYNTRADKAAAPQNNMWTASFQNRRCIVPTYGFYEPHQTETVPSPKTGKPIKRQYLFGRPGTNLVFIAGIYEGDHFSMMTTDPNRWIEPIHHRMPVVIAPDEFDQWLHGDYAALLNRQETELTVKAAV